MNVAAVFRLDPRARIALRIALGLLLLASVADRARDFGAFYTDAGLTRRDDFAAGSFFVPWNGPSALQPFAWLPDPWGSLALFASAALAGIALVLGRGIRVAAAAGWLALTGMDNRNPLVINAGDDLLRMFFLWFALLPLPEENGRVTPSSIAFVIQLASLYFFSALLKSYQDWVEEGSALHYALALEQFATPLGRAFREHLPLALSSAGVWWLELLGPFALLCPFATAPLRIFLFVAFAGMHVGIALTMGIGLFSAVAITAWMAVLPSSVWDAVDRLLGRAPPTAADPSGSPPFTAARELTAGFLAVVVLLGNIAVVRPALAGSMPGVLAWLGFQLRTAQAWNMFSPSPARFSTWLDLQAETGDGRILHLAPDGAILPGLPTSPETDLRERWRKLHERLLQTHPSELETRYLGLLSRRVEAALHEAPRAVRIVQAAVDSAAPGGPRSSPAAVQTRTLAVSPGW